ncbi:MAG: TetR/AcrR family transcriptional regulator [Thermoleophilaceae bacterium]|nr:TetR/AcrR family transcriptional regulator [Thermoleophilaceae bacterium]
MMKTLKKCGRSYGGESQEVRDARRRTQLLDAGLQIFGTEGFRAATVRGVCAEAHVADRNFYENFASLEDLLTAVHRRSVEELLANVVAAIGEFSTGTDVESATRRGFNAYFEFVEDPLQARVVWREILGVSPSVDAAYLADTAMFGELLISLLSLWRPNFTRDDEADVIVTTVVGGLSNMAMVWSLNGYEPSREVMVRAAGRLLLSVAAVVDG